MKLTVTVKQRAAKTGSGFEGSYKLPSSTTAKLARKDGTTLFPNAGSLKSTARRLASTLGAEVEFSEPAKKAAKKSVKSKTKKAASAKKSQKPSAQSSPASANTTSPLSSN